MCPRNNLRTAEPAAKRQTGYPVAAAVSALAWMGRELLTPVIGPTALPYVFFFPAVAASTCLGGPGPGLLATGLAATIAVVRFMTPTSRPPALSIADMVSLVSFLTASALVMLSIEIMQRTHGRLKRGMDERARLETELALGRQEHTRLAAIVEGSGEAILIKDLEGTVQTWNASAGRLFGYTEQEIVGRPITALIPPDRLDEEREVMARLRAGSTVERMETLRLAKGGRAIPVAISVSPLRDGSGQVAGASTIMTDITAIVDTRMALERERQFLATTLASIGDAVIVTDAQGGVTFLNAEAERLTGWSRSQAVGLELPAVLQIVNEHTREVVESPVDKVKRLGTVVGLANHTILISSDRVETPIDDSAAPIVHEGHLVGVVLVFRDVTERKRSEDALRQADRRKSEFLAVLSHELRNPLNPIQLAAEMLRQLGLPQPELGQLRDVIDRQARQLARLLDDLLDLSRIDSGKMTLRRSRIGLGAAIATAVEASRPLIDAAGHALIVRIPDEPIEVDGDVARLSQVVSNLLNNAAKFTEPGGQISVTLEAATHQAIIRVKDTGMGIAPGQLPHLFEMFAQGQRTLERAHGGLGIGLALCRKLVDLHGGRVEAVSEGVGRGSEFVVSLPLLSPEIAPPLVEPSESLSDQAARLRILVAEDDVDSAEMLAAALGLAGHVIRLAHDGVTTLAMADAFQPHVILLDISLPGINGYDVARRIRSDHGSAVMLIAVTGWGQDDDKRLAMEAGIDHHITKPISVEVLQALFPTVRRHDSPDPLCS